MTTGWASVAAAVQSGLQQFERAARDIDERRGLSRAVSGTLDESSIVKKVQDAATNANKSGQAVLERDLTEATNKIQEAATEANQAAQGVFDAVGDAAKPYLAHAAAQLGTSAATELAAAPADVPVASGGLPLESPKGDEEQFHDAVDNAPAPPPQTDAGEPAAVAEAVLVPPTSNAADDDL